ncbi:MAG: prepilin-type N-terminal cleavage/methylation domain-containing protein [Magnetococcales bacterium]|nr:prepilin-type N-terminal cleavage/methylation domain-containing protein [Magnetococcales bacterium]
MAMKSPGISTARRRSGGFSMIELSIVMIIIGLIIAGGVTVYEPSMKQTLKNKNETVVRRAVETLIGFAGAHRALPEGIVNSGVLNSPQDAQMNGLQYAYAAELIQVNTVCHLDETPLSVQVLKADGSVNFTVTDVAFVVWSRGYDGVTKPAKPAGAVGEKTAYPVPLYAENEADDLVGWATMPELKAAAGCGASPLRILASGVPAASVGAVYPEVKLTPDGGKGPYRWCVEFPDQVRASRLRFTAEVPLTPREAFGVCTTPEVQGNTLTMAGQAPFAATDQGGPFDFVVHLQDSNTKAHRVSRRFSLFVIP